MQRKPLSESTKVISGNFADETSRAIQAVKNSKKLKIISPERDEEKYLQDYIKACHEFLPGQKLLPEEALNKIIRDILEDSNLKYNVSEGSKICITVVPFSLYGNDLEDEGIQNFSNVRIFFIDKDGITLSGLINEKSNHYKLLPKVIQEKCTSAPVHYENDDLKNISDSDREKLIKEVQRIFNQGREIFGE